MIKSSTSSEMKWIHCESHGSVHEIGWCRTNPEGFTNLESTNRSDAVEECRRKKLWLYHK